MKSLLLRCGTAVFYTTLCYGAPIYNVLTENFDNVSALSDWVILNRSQPVGTTSWFQGNSGIFPAESGASASYIAANFLNAGAGGNISNWLISPLLTFNNGDLISFYSRTDLNPAPTADRLELRFNPSGSTNVGSTALSVGDFTNLLLTINPSLTATGYPAVWTPYSSLISGLTGPTNARFAFRYSVPDTSTNGDYIGVDSLSVMSEVPEPGTLWNLAAAGVLWTGFALWRRRTRILAAAITVICLFTLTLPVFGADPSTSKDQKSKRAARKSPQSAGRKTAGSAAVRIYIDPQTGETREAPVQPEVQRRSPAPSSAVVSDNPDGSKTAILGDDYMVQSVAKLNPDGSVSISHVSKAQAKHPKHKGVREERK